MSLTTFSLGRRFAVTGLVARLGLLPLLLVAVPHLVAAAVMVWYEITPYSMSIFLLSWGLLNFFWLALFGRAALAATLSLLLVALLIIFSEFKYSVLWIQLSFVDLMIADTDTAHYLLTIFPWLGLVVLGVAALLVPLMVLIYRADPLRLRRRYALAGVAGCLFGIVALTSMEEVRFFEQYQGNRHVSFFVRSGVAAISELMTHGIMESDATVSEQLKSMPAAACTPAKRPHIILVHDESSFDIRSAPGINVPPGYGQHFKSFDGKERRFLVEGVGGPSWYAEYSVLTGLSARSFGRFSYFVTRVAPGRIARGLPNALTHCGYQTRTIFPVLGAFMSARTFHTSVGVQRFTDGKDMGVKGIEPDGFFFNKAVDMLESERAQGPMFIYVYLAANHFPWTYRYRPDLMPQWKDLQNPPIVNEYLRRQAISAQDYQAFLADLKKKFPGESFLLLRYGDHQPDFSTEILEPSLDPATVLQHFMKFDPKYYTTYYAIDAINFKPVDVSSALDTLDAPYIPLVIQEAAGLPLDPSFEEQKKIMQRCNGVFYGCNAGAEARRFNRLLIEAGLIKER